MQRNFFYLLLLLPLLTLSNCKAEETESVNTEFEFETTEEPSPCDYGEELVDGKCIDVCYSRGVCGNYTTCSSSGTQTYCVCIKGYAGNPIDGCFKMDELSPCDPNPCGPNSECIAEHPEIGPHCKCEKGFYDWPPKCRAGCSLHSECGPTEFCNSTNFCEELCQPSRCGENSICRVDKVKRTMHCSCKDGFIPEKDIGCRSKTADEPEILIDFLESILSDGCDDTCGYNAYCESNGTCVCTQSYIGDPLKECKLIQPARTDPCNPNPCGGYSTCEIIDDKAKCKCIEGYGIDKYCSKCFSNIGCVEGSICSDGRCVPNVCEHFCGYNVGCNIYEGKLECLCPIQAVNEHSKPYIGCPDSFHISAAVIAALAG